MPDLQHIAKLQKHRVKELPQAEFYYVSDWFQEQGLDHQKLFDTLLKETPWEQGQIRMYGKLLNEARSTKLYSDRGEYHYSNRRVTGGEFPECLKELRAKLEAELGGGYEFDTVLLNLYEDGDRNIGEHSDKEDDLVEGAPIVSVSLGATRRFDVFRKLTPEEEAARKQWRQENPGKTQPREKVSFNLPSGSVFIMGVDSQKKYTHMVPKQTTIKTPRINITFRVTKSRG